MPNSDLPLLLQQQIREKAKSFAARNDLVFSKHYSPEGIAYRLESFAEEIYRLARASHAEAPRTEAVRSASPREEAATRLHCGCMFYPVSGVFQSECAFHLKLNGERLRADQHTVSVGRSGQETHAALPSSPKEQQEAAEDARMGHVRLDECSDGKDTTGLPLYERISAKIQKLSDEASELRHTLLASGGEMDSMRGLLSAAEHRRAAAEYRAQRIVLDDELKQRAEKAEAALSRLTQAHDEQEKVHAEVIDRLQLEVEVCRCAGANGTATALDEAIALIRALPSPPQEPQ